MVHEAAVRIMPKPKILVIEDERSLVEVLTLQPGARRIRGAASRYDGQEGLRQAQLKLPDLVVLDLMLPGKPGLEVCRELRIGAADARDPDHHGDGQGRGDRTSWSASRPGPTTT